MQTLITNGLPTPLSEGQRKALISLLVDDDPAIYQVIRKKLLSYGSSACDWLRPYMLSSDPSMRRRAREIVEHFAMQNSDQTFLAFCLNNGEEFDLEEAVGLLALTQYPSTNLEGYRALYDSWASELRTRIDRGTDAETILGAINHYLFEELSFGGDEHAIAILLREQPPNRGSGDQAPAAESLGGARFCGGGRASVLRAARHRGLPARREIRRSDSQGYETR